MSQKQDKRLRRMIRKERNNIIQSFLKAVHNPSWPYRLRIKLAFQILGKGKKENNKIMKMYPKTTHETFVVGDQVRSTFYPKENKIIRTVTCVTAHKFTRSKYVVAADGGKYCETCGLQGTPIKDIDAAFFVKIQPIQTEKEI
jgi:hypothetical protein